MLMIRVGVRLQISRGIFAYGKIIQMHTIHESTYTVIKLPRNGNCKAKKTTKHNPVCTSYQAQLMWEMHLIIFTKIIYA